MTGITTDRSGNGYSGSLIGMSTTTSPVQGKIGQALKFDGTSSYIPTANIAATNGATFLTLSAWIKQDSLVQAKSFVSKFLPAGHHWAFFSGDAGDPSEIACEAGNNSVAYSPSGAHAAGVWEHWVCVFDGTQADNSTRLKLYKNGILQTASYLGTVPATLDSNSAAVTIGADPTPASYWNGAIDDVRIYNRALTNAEIHQLYLSGQALIKPSTPNKVAVARSKPGPGTLRNGLMLYWTMDGGDIDWKTGQIRDASGNGNTGFITSIATTTGPVSGAIGQGQSFDGVASYIATNGTVAFPSTNQFSFSFWMKATTPELFNIAAWYTRFCTDSGFGDIVCTVDGDTTGGATTASDLEDGRWHHIAYTDVGNSQLLYVDGVQKGSGSETLDTTDQTVSLGNRAFSSGFYLGNLDDFRLYNRALTAQEIRQLYLMGK